MNAVVQFQAPRLPYHPAINERFGVDASGWKALVEAVFPSAKSHDAVVMALSYCKARKLDPFKKPVHIVPMWDSKSGGYVETVWPGISEVRTTAFRTGQYVGCDEAEFGPTIERTFTGKVKVKGNWEEKTVAVAFPEWCRMTVHREMGGRPCKFVGPKVKWIESYATIGNSDLPNDMWESRPEGQIEKCAEAAALRKAFPEEIGNQLTAEEMEGRRIHGDGQTSSNASAPPPPPPAAVETIAPPAPTAASGAEVEDATIISETATAGPSPVEAPAADASPVPPPVEGASAADTDEVGINPDDEIANLIDKLAHAKDETMVEEWYVETDIEAALGEFTGYVEKARAVKAQQIDRVNQAAARDAAAAAVVADHAPPAPPAPTLVDDDEAPPPPAVAQSGLPGSADFNMDFSQITTKQGYVTFVDSLCRHALALNDAKMLEDFWNDSQSVRAACVAFAERKPIKDQIMNQMAFINEAIRQQKAAG